MKAHLRREYRDHLRHASPELATRIRAEIRAGIRPTVVRGWGYYPNCICDGDTDPEIRFRKVVELYMFSIKSDIVRGNLHGASHDAAALFARIERERVERADQLARRKVIDLADFRLLHHGAKAGWPVT